MAQGGGILGQIGQRMREALEPMVVRGYIRKDLTLNGPTAYCLQNRKTGAKQKQAVYGKPGPKGEGFETTGTAPFDCDVAEAQGALVLGAEESTTPPNGVGQPNALRFDDVTFVDIRLGMDERTAIEQIQKSSPSLKATPHWLSVVNNNGSLYNGALGAPLPAGADAMSAPGGPFVKIGVLIASPGEPRLSCVTSLRPGYPGTSAAQQNKICERIWLQTTPAKDGATVVAMSRVLVFGGNTKPSLKALWDDLVKKFGSPSSTPTVVRMPSGDIYPTTFVWEFDRSGRVVPKSQNRAVDDGTVDFGVPEPYVPSGTAGVPTIRYSGRTTVITGYGPEFTAAVTETSPRLLSATLAQDASQPLLATRLSLVVYDPVAVVRNRSARIEVHNNLVDQVNAAKEGKDKEDAEKASQRARPPL